MGVCCKYSNLEIMGRFAGFLMERVARLLIFSNFVTFMEDTGPLPEVAVINYQLRIVSTLHLGVFSCYEVGLKVWRRQHESQATRILKNGRESC